MKSVNIVTLGCSKNTVDSENIAGHLQNVGFTVKFDDARNSSDIVIINTKNACDYLRVKINNMQKL